MIPRITLGRAHALATAVVRELQEAGVQAAATPVGSLRRFAPDVGGVALLAVAERADHASILRAFTRLPSAAQVSASEPDGATIVTRHGPVTLHVVEPEAAGPRLVWLTGSIGHVHALAAIAGRLGLTFAAGSLATADGTAVPCPTEEEFYARLGLPYLPPEVRHGEDELDVALGGPLPPLLADVNMRGDLHMHSLWSDGRDSIEAMVQASAGLGYEYIAMTDHSQRAMASRTLSVADVTKQRAEIQRLQERYPGIRILHGVEVDIMLDGSLDFDDEVLAGFDIVLASLHDHGGQSGAVLTDRYLAAARSPYVDVLTHPMGRSPGLFEGYPLDLDRLFAAAVATGTALEVDGAPGHLDMDGAIARRAAAAGVTIVVDSDCHRAEWLRRQMRFAVGTARRGWLEPRHVLNAGPVEDVLAFVARKRNGG